MSKMNICKNEENWTCGNNEVVVDNPLNWSQQNDTNIIWLNKRQIILQYLTRITGKFLKIEHVKTGEL